MSDAEGDDTPATGDVVTRDELSGVLENLMGRMMTDLVRTQQESIAALRSDLAAQISAAVPAAASAKLSLPAQPGAAPAPAPDLNAAFAAQRAAEAKAAQALVAQQALAAKLRSDYEAQMLAAGIALPATPVAASAASVAPARTRSDFRSTVDQVIINADPSNNVAAAVMRRRIADNRQLPKPQQNSNLAPRRALWGADPQLTRGAVTSSREEALRRAVRPPSHVAMGGTSGIFEVSALTTGASQRGFEDGAEILDALSTAVRPTANEVARMPKADIGGPANLRGITLLNVRARELSRQTEAYRVAESVRDHNFMSDTNVSSEQSLMRIVEAMLYAPADLLVREGQFGPPEMETRALVADMALVARYDRRSHRSGEEASLGYRTSVLVARWFMCGSGVLELGCDGEETSLSFELMAQRYLQILLKVFCDSTYATTATTFRSVGSQMRQRMYMMERFVEETIVMDALFGAATKIRDRFKGDIGRRVALNFVFASLMIRARTFGSLGSRDIMVIVSSTSHLVKCCRSDTGPQLARFLELQAALKGAKLTQGEKLGRAKRQPNQTKRQRAAAKKARDAAAASAKGAGK